MNSTGEGNPLIEAPEICIEILPPRKTRAEIEKSTVYPDFPAKIEKTR